MYNLFVKGTEEPYLNEGFDFSLDRSIRAHEYTEEHLALRYGTFTEQAIQEIMNFPAILAFEKGLRIAPQFAKITNIERKPNAGVVTISFEFIEAENPPSAEAFADMSNALDLGKWELNRTHWALKAVDLQAALATVDCQFVQDAIGRRPYINIENHRFNIALSFPGMVRERVERIIPGLEKEFGPNSYFYDRNYIGELARPNHDLILQSIYRDRSELVIVFVGSAYAERDWCGVEWDAIRDSILGRHAERRVMFIRTDDGNVPGLNRQDGYIDWRNFSDEEIIEAIINRYHGDRLPDPMLEARDAEAALLDRLREEAIEGRDMLDGEILEEEKRFEEEKRAAQDE